MKRTPEPVELMDETDNALAYAQADFSEANLMFLELFQTLHPQPFVGTALDLGCGSADIPLRFCRTYPDSQVEALDGAQAMLDLAQDAIKEEKLDRRISLHCKFLPALDLPAAHYDAVLSNSLLHHLSDPADIWRTIKHCGRKGATILVMDLLRPESPEEVDQLVARYAADAPDALVTDFGNSLHASYTVAEVQQQLSATGLHKLDVEQISNRHLAVKGFL